METKCNGRNQIQTNRKNSLQTKTAKNPTTFQRRLVRVFSPMPRQLPLHRRHQQPPKTNANPRIRQGLKIRQSKRLPPTSTLQKMQRQNRRTTSRIQNKTTHISSSKNQLVRAKQKLIIRFRVEKI